MRQLILASTSPYRLQLLRQLQLPFTAVPPVFEEVIDPAVSAELMVRHLALGKARSLAERYPQALIIGADQVFVDQRGRAVGKPGSKEAAIAQLKQMVGRTHAFFTGLALFDGLTQTYSADYSAFAVTLRQLSDTQIVNYVEREKTWECAGSFKIEGLGIALMEKMAGDDYNSLIGLPLIKLVTMLNQYGVDVLGESI
ncbi:MAG: septum formation protein Maf [Deltaproteobacteria bacterium]|nr:septum formation protein Maf [Deltaproteobacteria bacterium]NCP01984.1 septum formation protein Maf [Deltaproteobacteria bacterium]NCP77654.1 septum formation protein Maf [Desulfuromonadales bacterium]